GLDLLRAPLPRRAGAAGDRPGRDRPARAASVRERGAALQPAAARGVRRLRALRPRVPDQHLRPHEHARGRLRLPPEQRAGRRRQGPPLRVLGKGMGEEGAPTVGVGMLGYGFMGRAHANAYHKLPYTFWPPPAVPRLVAVCGRTEVRVAEAARRYA